MATETALITGASSGIGLELARLFAAAGSRLVLVARRAELLEQLAAELRQQWKVDVRVLASDLSRPQAPDEIVRTLADWRVDIDVLVNNAGFGAQGEFVSLGVQRQMNMLAVNVAAPTHLARLLLPGMLERRRGGVLNVGSLAGFIPGPYMVVYYATKAYLLSFSEALAEEVRGRGVTVTCLAPGPTHSGFAAAAQMNEARLFRAGAMTSKAVARAGYAGFRRGKVLVIPGGLNGVVPWVVRLVPRALVRKFTAWLQR